MVLLAVHNLHLKGAPRYTEDGAVIKVGAELLPIQRGWCDDQLQGLLPASVLMSKQDTQKKVRRDSQQWLLWCVLQHSAGYFWCRVTYDACCAAMRFTAGDQKLLAFRHVVLAWQLMLWNDAEQTPPFDPVWTTKWTL